MIRTGLLLHIFANLLNPQYRLGGKQTNDHDKAPDTADKARAAANRADPSRSQK